MNLLGIKRGSLVARRLQSRTRVNSQYSAVFTKHARTINGSSRFQQKSQEKERSFTGKLFSFLGFFWEFNHIPKYLLFYYRTIK